jgi:5-methylcytosine-specific restriction endonuclease McrA
MLTHPIARRTELWLIDKVTRSPLNLRTHSDASDAPFAQIAAIIVEFGVIPIRERPDPRLVWENLQSSCKPCHAAKTAREWSGW